MIQEFVDTYQMGEMALRFSLRAIPPEDYEALIERVLRPLAGSNFIEITGGGEYHGDFRITFGKYTGGISYGSCSGCDLWKSIVVDSYCGEILTEAAIQSNVDVWMSMALHIIQSIKLTTEYSADE